MRKRIFSKISISRFNFPTWSVPIALLVLCIISFGLLTPALGYYWDDWPVIYIAKTHGNFWKYYQSDRPFSAWMDIFASRLLGLKPLYWHLFFFLLLWLTVVLMWWGMTKVWPKHVRQVTWVAMLFMVYPAFTQQSIAVTYIRALLPYATFFASVAAMIAAVRYRRWFWPLTFFSLMAALFHLFTTEYFAGLELVRPILLWIVFSENYPKIGDRVLRLLKTWTPYFLVMVGYVIWRLFFIDPQNDPHAPILIFSFLNHPLSTTIHLIIMSLQDFIYVLVTNWYQTLQLELIDIQPPFNLFAWGIAILAGFSVIMYLLHLDNAHSKTTTDLQFGWSKQAIFVGIYSSFVGMLPFWIIEHQVTLGMYANRVALPAIFGAAILIVGLLEYFARTHLPKIILFGVLVGLAVGFQVRVQNNYRWDWTLQRRFYWQLYWRAPAVKPGTEFFSESSILPKTARYSLAMAINTLYSPPAGTTNLPYWISELDDIPASIPDIIRGADCTRDMRSLSFKTSCLNSLPILFDSVSGRCLWILSPEDIESPDIPPLTASILSVANLSQIEARPSSPEYPDTSIFGPEPPHTWCYYFEKAELARQFSDWNTIEQLGDQVESLGYHPDYIYEWRSFIEGYAHTGGWDKAQYLILDIYQSAYQQNPDLSPELCMIWNRLLVNTSSSPAREAATYAVTQTIKCQTP
jgi:hypothetical protein